MTGDCVKNIIPFIMRTAFTIISIFSVLIAFSFTARPKNALRDDVLKYTNEFRKAHKLSPLEMKDELNEIAQKHSKNMARGIVGFGHDGFSERAEKVRKKLGDYMVAENVAYGIETGKAAVELWKTSPGHRKNLLGSFKYIGIGTATDDHGNIYFTQIF